MRLLRRTSPFELVHKWGAPNLEWNNNETQGNGFVNDMPGSGGAQIAGRQSIINNTLAPAATCARYTTSIEIANAVGYPWDYSWLIRARFLRHVLDRQARICLGLGAWGITATGANLRTGVATTRQRSGLVIERDGGAVLWYLVNWNGVTRSEESFAPLVGVGDTDFEISLLFRPAGHAAVGVSLYLNQAFIRRFATNYPTGAWQGDSQIMGIALQTDVINAAEASVRYGHFQLVPWFD